MNGPLSTKLRLVRCPRCLQVLPESPNVPVYQCGGCNTVLQAKKRKNDSKNTDLHIPDTNMAKKADLEQDSENKEAQKSSSIEDKEARSLGNEEKLSSSEELPLDKNNGSDDKENEDSNMNQSGLACHGNEDSSPEAVVGQDKCSLTKNNGGDPNVYAQSNRKHIGGVNLSDEVASPTEPNHHKSAESQVDKSGNCLLKENGSVNSSKEVASPMDLNHLGSEESSPVAGAHSEVGETKNCLEQDEGRNQNELCNRKQIGRVNIYNEVVSSTVLNGNEIQLSSLVVGAQNEASKHGICNGNRTGDVNFRDEVVSSTELDDNEIKLSSPVVIAHSEANEHGIFNGNLTGGVNISDDVVSSTEFNENENEVSSPVVPVHSEANEPRMCTEQSNGRNQSELGDFKLDCSRNTKSSGEIFEANEHGVCNGNLTGGVNISDDVVSSTEFNENEIEVSSPVVPVRSESNQHGMCTDQSNRRNQSELGDFKLDCSRNTKSSGEIFSSTEVTCHEIEELPPVIDTNGQLDENLKHRMCTEQSNRRNRSELGDFKLDCSRNKKSSGEIFSSAEVTCQEIEESPPVIETNGQVDKNLKNHMSLDQCQKRELPGFDHAVDTLEKIAIADYSSEFSVTHRDVANFPTTSNYAYEGSVSSSDGIDDQVPDPYLQVFKRKEKRAESRKRDEVMNKIVSSYPEMEGDAWNCSSIPSEKKNYTMEGKWHQDELMEPMRHGPRVQSKMRFESGYPPRVPFYSRDAQVSYEKGGPSNYRREEHQYRASLHSPKKPEKNHEEEKMQLMKMVIDLQDQLNRTRISQGLGPEVDMCPRRCHQGRSQPHQNRTSRIPFSAEAKMSRYHVEKPCFHCCPHDRMSSAPLPPHLFYNKSPYKAHQSPRYSNLYTSNLSSPQYRTSSEFSMQSYDPTSDDRELKKCYRERNRLNRHVRPVVGGAPFVICYRCSELLQLPLDFLMPKRRFHKLMCSACLTILKFSLEDGTRLLPYTDDHDYATEAVAPPPSEVDDYGPSLGKSCSTETEQFSVGLPFQALKRDSNGRKILSGSSFEPMGETTRGPIFKELENKNKNPVEMFGPAEPPSTKMAKAGRTSSEIEELRPLPSSPLHKLMGYTSPSQVMDR